MPKLVIVESPTKAKTINRFLGKGYLVTSSFGHIRDLPAKNIGVDVEHDFKPEYVIPEKSKKTVSELKSKAKKCDEIYYATDEDREGEAIAWHLQSILKTPAGKTKRIVFHEITKTAIDEAIKNPRTIDIHLVDAQQARRIVDRLVGYKLSPFLWEKVARGLSAGRVQSVAVRLIVEREEEIERFKPQEYWTIDSIFTSAHKTDFSAKLFSHNGKKLDKFDVNSKDLAQSIVDNAQKSTYTIGEVKRKQIKRSPNPPFTTSTLQQDANRKLGYSARQTMRLAQQLYEGIKLPDVGQVGLITYMRTDSVNLSQKFITESRDLIAKDFGKDFLPEKPRLYSAKSKLAQEAHEAIRPTEVSYTPASVQSALDPQQYKMYELIWNRAVASQMTDAQFDSTSIDVPSEDGALVFRANGSILKFAGFYKVYPDAVKETLLPDVHEKEKVNLKFIEPKQHFTEPPARYSEAGLVKALEERGIGRPSTYAPTISTIVDRGYVIKDNRRLQPTDIARLVNKVLVGHFPNIVDYDFTARMEENLDEIAEGKKEWVPVVKEFYMPFIKNLEKKDKELDKKELTEEKSDEVCDKCSKPMIVKTGRYGRFLACTGYPDCKNTINLNGKGEKDAQAPAEPIGVDPETKLPVFLKTGRFGTYVQLGEKQGKEKPKTASLLPGMNPSELTLEVSLKLLTLPRTVGKTDDGEDIIATNGRFGPYIKAGKETRSLTPDMPPTTVTLEQAKKLLAEPKTASRTRGKVALKDLGKDPDGNDIKIFSGRYGPYVSDGKTNASLPKDQPTESLTLDQAIVLIQNKR
ncbi:MAG: type I DNA topoisomerase [Patescibacteria group bacterium]|jgi:DNA topoisomerase-1